MEDIYSQKFSIDFHMFWHHVWPVPQVCVAQYRILNVDKYFKGENQTTNVGPK